MIEILNNVFVNIAIFWTFRENFQLDIEKQKLYYCQIKVLLDTLNFWYRMTLLQIKESQKILSNKINLSI